MDLKKSFRAGIIAVVLITAIATVAVSSAEAAIILKGQTQSYWVAPAGSFSVYYCPNGGSPSVLDARISMWYHWINPNPPTATVDIYAGSGSQWYWISQMNLEPTWTSSYPLWLSGGAYKFEIRTSEMAEITLRVRDY